MYSCVCFHPRRSPVHAGTSFIGILGAPYLGAPLIVSIYLLI